MDYYHPLSDFLEFGSAEKQVLKSRLQKLEDKAKVPTRKAHSLVQYKECKEKHLDVSQCYHKVRVLLNQYGQKCISNIYPVEYIRWKRK